MFAKQNLLSIFTPAIITMIYSGYKQITLHMTIIYDPGLYFLTVYKDHERRQKNEISVAKGEMVGMVKGVDSPEGYFMVS